MTIASDPQPSLESVAHARQRQMREAQDLLFSGPPRAGFAKALYKGEFRGDALFPYPLLSSAKEAETAAAVAAVRQFADQAIDAAAIDRDADIPAHVIQGLGRLGVLGMTAPVDRGGRGFGQYQYCRVMEVIGGHCASTAVFINAHHSIGVRALLLFGTPEQQARWLPDLMSGRKLAAFALTETEAGSDAANVQTCATPSEDGRTFYLTGGKRYITNGAIADVLTVMARTPDPRGGPSKITAFLVTPDMPGFQVVEGRMPKCGIRGTATATLAFQNMPVPAENILGPIGKGLRVALTVLDFGRTTFGASCTGAAKTCLVAATRHAAHRKQFGRPLGELELIRKKLARIAAFAYAMEAATYETAALIDSGADDYMLETAILKVWSTDELWRIVFDTMQIYGGKGFFTDEPLGRWMRDARLNTIGEGSNDVLRPFIAMVGIKPVADLFLRVKDAMAHPLRQPGKLLRFVGEQLHSRLTKPQVPTHHSRLKREARDLGARVRDFGLAIQSALIRHREQILFRQLVQERLANAACELYASACVLSRLDHLLSEANGHAGQIERDLIVGKHFLHESNRRIRQNLAAVRDNEDPSLLRAARAVLEG